MTRQEFIDEVCDFYDLIAFCNDEHLYDFTDAIICGEDYDACVEEDICDRNGSWESLRDCLNDLPSGGYDYYRRDGWLDYVWLDDNDFLSLKDEVLEYCDRYGTFEEDEEDEEEPYDPDSFTANKEEFSLFFSSAVPVFA